MALKNIFNSLIVNGSSGNRDVHPVLDGLQNLGIPSNRWSAVYAVNGSIQTSDGNQKQQIRELSQAEKDAAAGIKLALKAFKFNDAVTLKGDKARIHIGVIAQEVKAIFDVVGLDANDYGLFCSDTWYTDALGNNYRSEFDEKGNKIANLTATTQLGIRYEELLAFVIAAL